MSHKLCCGCFLFPLILVICYSLFIINNRLTEKNRRQWDANISTISNRFPVVNNADSGVWISGCIGSNSLFPIGPSIYRLRCYINRISETYPSVLSYNDYIIEKDEYKIDDEIEKIEIPEEQESRVYGRRYFSSSLRKDVLGQKCSGVVCYYKECDVLYFSVWW